MHAGMRAHNHTHTHTLKQAQPKNNETDNTQRASYTTRPRATNAQYGSVPISRPLHYTTQRETTKHYTTRCPQVELAIYDSAPNTKGTVQHNAAR